ncbi:hypothetical protein CGLO_13828 [Colletotrichum gloeosporioides Cg-14]|uniref:Uncharacterized protein n=1 Tax=Colletotrichum gloeosporioides (strain Cg-14) TaxID=1237896 RepID=T0K585_COLGC|nr:hypothetical protein CGLO_13828 [Colletotrichum gloeosporioides Cg-14]
MLLGQSCSLSAHRAAPKPHRV